MPVRFKGISEYRSKYKGRTSRSRSDSPHRRMRLAGLRSDQSGITQEPQFISKRRVPFYPSQVSSSFRWEGRDHSQQQLEKSRSPAVSPVLRATSAERQVTPLAPRDPPEGTTAPSQPPQAEAAQTSTFAVQKQKQALNGINHALRMKAGLRSEHQRNGLNSEYQRQFMWKTPVAESPLLAAHQMLYSNNRAIPPFKTNPVIMESEYKRSFKGSPLPRPPRLRRDVEQYEVPEFLTESKTPEKSKRKKKKKERPHSRKSSPEQEVAYLQQQEVKSPHNLKDPSPKVMRKGKTEYRSNFHSPLQYSYKDGAWLKIKSAKEEVKELRERAEAYKKRAWGTHFSRQHLNQILSDQNWMWEPSSGTSSSSIESEACRSTSHIIEALDLARAGSVRESSSPGHSASVVVSRRSSSGEVGLPEEPTLPVQRKLAWDEEEQLGEREEIVQDRLTDKEGKTRNENGMERNERLNSLESESLSSAEEGSEASVNGGRLPTPKLKTMQTVQRTHHDRTTPSIDFNLHYIAKAANGSLPRSSPVAGLTTVDVLPMREDVWSDEEVTDYRSLKPPKPSRKQQSSQRHKANAAPPANRIQGTMRNAEFQHNGNLGIFRPELFVLPQSDSALSDNDDKMSQISSRSAASCSMASEVLGRAQRRKQEFWGKS
ncbi:nuclear protein MDM1 [Danio rerio]|uniref:Nuclear protein MDM1 n=2 Tax=Danio rerio TaxID=7955 RepID=MDM1_DANRE|nr:nuclear protein MDM1 [Danio rerio]Q5RHU7.1 RecName: Full=Nuclear protein MDM1 [Danio rerio]|eukprot:NP_001038285.1 nuclear protein MDM1 [Danio rerio]